MDALPTPFRRLCAKEPSLRSSPTTKDEDYGGWKCEVDTLRSFSEGGLPYCFGGFRRTIGITGFARGAPYSKQKYSISSTYKLVISIVKSRFLLQDLLIFWYTDMVFYCIFIIFVLSLKFIIFTNHFNVFREIAYDSG